MLLLLLLMEEHAKVSEGYRREKVQELNRIQFRTCSDGDFQIQRRVGFRDYKLKTKKEKTIRYYIITQGKGLLKTSIFTYDAHEHNAY